MAFKSKKKGKGGELEVAELLRANGFPAARRGVQYQGGTDSPDVVGLDGFNIEVKRTERFSLYDALEQAKTEAKAGDIATVFHRPNRKPWVVVMDAVDFLALVRAATSAGRIQAPETRPKGTPSS